MPKNPPVPTHLLTFGRAMRHQPTDAEQRLWQRLRNRQVKGAKFRRQHPFGSFILDFYCKEAHLAIELDGGEHLQPKQAEEDKIRDAALVIRGIHVLRFWDDEVLRETERVLQVIWDVLPEQGENA